MTCHRLSGIGVFLGLFLAGAALAQDASTTPAEPSGVTCTVSGYDVIIHNKGDAPIASGASVQWSVPFARKEGSHALIKDLEPGGRVFLAGALGSNFLSSKAECEATLGTAEVQPAPEGASPPPPN